MTYRDKSHTLALTLVLAFCPLAAQAVSKGETLAREKACLSCHSVAKKVIGPAYKDVAKKYRHDARAPARLFDKVRQGGQGVWGKVPMPPQTELSDDELKTILSWVLQQ
ncbi:MAG TPA: c-type cytochrome [Thiobacillaceae bacterium]|nr:c-type cytochrome [Thiobacillaceae bacterium]HNU65036.1 c-type cytochrome [Thiobacillaceae bacterium]